MKHLQAVFSFLISVAIVLSAVVLPAARVFDASDTDHIIPDAASESAPASAVLTGRAGYAPDGAAVLSPAGSENAAAQAAQGTTDALSDEPEQADGASPADPADTRRQSSPKKTADEPAQTIDTVIPLAFGESYAAVLASADDRYVYPFTVTERGYINYTISHAELHDFKGWEAALYREYYLNGVDGEVGYQPLNVLKTTALNTTDAAPSIGVLPGEYRLVVRSSAGVSSEEYVLKAEFTPAYDHEIECNDTKAAYTELYPGIPMIGSASCYTDKQDADWYLLRVRQDGKAEITFTHATTDSVSVAWRIALYDENGTEIYAENSGLNTQTVYSGELGIAKGVYFLAVLCRVRCDADYTLSVTTTADDRFERENNDTKETADALALGGTVSGCVTAKAGRLDRDIYRFEMPARGNFALVFTHAPAALPTDKNGWNVKLYAANGALLYAMISTWNVGTARMPVLGLEPGTYYVEVNSEDLFRSTLTYTLIAGYNESSGFEMEPNNTPEAASPIAQGVPVTGAIIDGVDPDDDYYCFTVTSYCRVTVTLEHDETEGDRDIFRFSVTDKAGERMPLCQSATATDADGAYFVTSRGNQPRVNGYYDLAPGTYYLKVTSGRFFDTMNYTIAYYVN
ncbi:MAG: hypothetical protein IJK89_01895 [Clostridia bacterium]|nr:hypothetical protein [Clostridia bacterium]